MNEWIRMTPTPMIRWGGAVFCLLLLLTIPATAAAEEAGVSVTVDVPNPLEPLINEVERARQAVEELKRVGETAERMAEAVKNLETVEIRLENTRIDIAARDGGISPDEIRNMRKSGLGWGVIAQQMGIHPGNLGLGHGNSIKNQPASGSGGKKIPPGQLKKMGGKGKGKKK